MTRAYKFLRAGAVGPFSGHRWPLPAGDAPGPWVEAAGDASLCSSAVHGCRVADLPWWIQDELWEAEFDGPVARGRHKLSAQRARLVRRIAAWEDDGCIAFSHACAWRARDHAATALDRAGAAEEAETLRACDDLDAVLAATSLATPEDARLSVAMAADGAARALQGRPSIATTAYIAAHAAAHLDGPGAHDAERAWQAAWLRDRLALADEPPGV